MDQPSNTFVDAAIGAVDALRLFAHNIRLPEVKSEATIDGSGATQREVIQFRSTQCWGDLIRTQDGITLSVSPIVGLTENFVARRLQFPRRDYAKSRLMTASADEVVANLGSDFLQEFAELIDIHQFGFQLVPYRLHDEDHLIMVRTSKPNDAELVKHVDDLANALNPALKASGLIIYTQHPAFDMAGTILLIDGQNQVHNAPGGRLGEQIEELKAAVKQLPPALRFNLVNGEFPATYSVMPHAFTLALPEDEAKAKIRGLQAAAHLGIQSNSSEILGRYRVTVTCPKPADDPIARAIEIMLEDWSASGSLIRPEILAKELGHEAPRHFEVQLTLLADKEAVESYRENGCFDLAPL